jgi:hypothetical protein
VAHTDLGPFVYDVQISGATEVTEASVREAVSRETGVPLARMTKSEGERLFELEAFMQVCCCHTACVSSC